jgi:hypothetical protein
MTTQKAIIEETESLCALDKLLVYIDFYIEQLALRAELKVGRSNVSFVHPIESFDYFSSPERIKVTDNGPDWEERKFAQKIRTDLTGIYDWYWKFKDRIFR